MLSLVATNVVASQPPKHRLTGTPTARAKHFSYNHLKDLSDFVLMTIFNVIQ